MNTNYRGEETCAACGCATGHAGYGEDSIGYVDGTIGPLCDDCNARLVEEIEADSDLWNQIYELVSRVDATENDAAKLRAALKPFAAVAKGIPNNWPGHCRLREDWREDLDDEFHQWLAYLGVNDGGTFPTIAEWREAAKTAGGEE